MSGRPFAIEAPPRTPEELRRWLRCALDVDPPLRPMEPGSATPFDYLAWAYFERTGLMNERRIAEAPHEAGPRESDPERPKQSSAGHGGQARQTDCVIWAPRGGGKTFYAAVATLLDLTFKPGIEVKILGGSLEQSPRMHEHLRRLFERPGLGRLLAEPMTRRGCRLDNGSGVEVLAQSHTSVRGTRPQRLRCDEVELFDPEIWRAAQLVTRSKRCGDIFVRGSVEALSTLHKPGGLMAGLVSEALGNRHQAPARNEHGLLPNARCPVPRLLLRWSILDVLEHCPPRRNCDSCALFDSCRGRAKEHRGGSGGGHVYIDDALTMLARSDRASWEAEMLCLRPRHSAAVLPEFDPAIHVVDDIVEALETGHEALDNGHPSRVPGAQCLVPSSRHLWVAGMDFGFRSPSVILLACVDESGVVRIVAESVQSGVLLASQIELLKRGLPDSSAPKPHAPRPKPLPPPAWIGVDPAGAQRSEQTGLSNITMMRHAGLVVRARRAPLEAGLNAIRARLAPASGPPTLFISRRCPRLIQALQTYHYNEERPSDPHPVKDGPDHLVDALRYLIVNLDSPFRASASAYW